MVADRDPSPGDLLGLLDAQRDFFAPVANSAPSSGGLDSALQLIAEQSQVMTHGGGSAIALRDGHSMFCRARAGSIAPPLGSAINFTSGLTGESVRTGQVLVCEDTEADPRVDVEVCRALGIRSLVVLPIKVAAELSGIFEVFSPEPGVFGEGEVQALESMRELIGSVMRPVPEQEWAAAAQDPQLAAEEAPSDLARTLLGDDAPVITFRNEDPEDDLVCEVESRRAAPMPAFAVPSPARDEEKKLPRGLMIAGVVTLVLVLAWLNWCSQGLQRPVARHLPIAPARKSLPSSATLPTANKPAPRRRAAAPPVNATGKATPERAPASGIAEFSPPPLSEVEMQGHEAPPPFASVLASAPPYPLVLPASPRAEDKLAASQETPRPNIDVLQRAADKGDPQAQLAMAVRYAFGDGVPQSYADALRWFSRAENKGVLPRLPLAVEARERTEAWVVQQMGRKP